MSRFTSRYERHELKYLLPLSLQGELEAFLAPYCVPDEHSTASPDGAYLITSLYLDTPLFRLLHLRLNNAPDRFNARVRVYGSTYRPPFFLEVKRKVSNVMYKSRQCVEVEDWLPWLVGTERQELEQKNGPVSTFETLFHTFALEPKVLVQYSRKAYVSTVDDYARVTFDQGLRYRRCEESDFSTRLEELASYDPVVNRDPSAGLILELKCYSSRVPAWMVDLITTFDLHRSSISKYASAALEAYSSNGDDGWEVAHSVLGD